MGSVTWHPTTSHVLASVSHDGSLRVWDIRAAHPLATIDAHTDKALAVNYSPEGRVFTGGADGVVRSWVQPSA
jgi:ribosome biogenesis protein